MVLIGVEYDSGYVAKIDKLTLTIDGKEYVSSGGELIGVTTKDTWEEEFEREV